VSQNLANIGYDFVMTIGTPSLGHVWAPPFTKIGRDGRLMCDLARRVKRRAPQDLLAKFRAIAEARDTDSAAVSFARKWGMLGLCRHGLPLWHAGKYCAARSFEMAKDWKDFAICLDSLHHIGFSLNRGYRGEDIDWELANSILKGPDFPPQVQLMRDSIRVGLVTARTNYMTLMRRLVHVCQVQPRFHWSQGTWNIDLDSETLSNLPAILAMQLMLEVGGTKQMVRCSSCPRWFIPHRNQRKYCSKCGIQAAWRDAAQRKRKGLAKARKQQSKA
jgi:hypothetical protein